MLRMATYRYITEHHCHHCINVIDIIHVQARMFPVRSVQKGSIAVVAFRSSRMREDVVCDASRQTIVINNPLVI